MSYMAPVLTLSAHPICLTTSYEVLPFIPIPDFDSMIAYKISVCAITSLSLSHLNAFFIHHCNTMLCYFSLL